MIENVYKPFYCSSVLRNGQMRYRKVFNSFNEGWIKELMRTYVILNLLESHSPRKLSDQVDCSAKSKKAMLMDPYTDVVLLINSIKLINFL